MATSTTHRARFSEADCRIEDFVELVATPTLIEDYPWAAEVTSGIVVYDSVALRDRMDDSAAHESIMAELAFALNDGPGVIVFRGAYPDASVVDAVSRGFQQIIDDEKAAGTAAGDHFAKAGVNDRVWNALEKIAILDPAAFVDYYANDMLALVCEAWLGPDYQVTSQVNQVNPGGKAQSPHRDYHLGFQSVSKASSYPIHTHHLSAVLTLQGAIAHCDMPLETGPTLLLPHSQKYAPGYIAWHIPEFQQYAESMFVQLPLKKGDAVFFNPALFHAAGENRTEDIKRMANLLQISSAFGRAMETIDRERIVNAIYPVLLERKRSGMSNRHLCNAIAASAEGYAFPTNLDRDQPSGSDAPPSQADLVRTAVDEEWTAERLRDALHANTAAHQSN